VTTIWRLPWSLTHHQKLQGDDLETIWNLSKTRQLQNEIWDYNVRSAGLPAKHTGAFLETLRVQEIERRMTVV